MADGQAHPSPARRETRRATFLAIALVVQTLAGVFFVADVATDVGSTGLNPHTTFEAFVVLALLIGIGFGASEMRRTIARIQRAEEALSLASGAFGTVVRQRFDGWGFTPAEADVALFALKGMDVAEIASLRGTAVGTVRAQLAQVYAKSGSNNRAQFAALFVEDLMDEAGLFQSQVG